MSDLTLAALCARAEQQRNLARLQGLPPPRIELVNIYDTCGNITQAQLDMRRKVEILKFTPTRMSTQTNTKTKQQRYAKALTTSITSARLQKLEAQLKAQESCSAVPMWSTASGVPGPPLLLYEDKNVPLYNYTAPGQSRAYPQTAPLLPPMFTFLQETNVVGNTATLCTLVVNNSVDRELTSFRLRVPFGLVATMDPLSTGTRTTISLDSVLLNILYGGALVKTIVPSSIPNYALVIDLSNSVQGLPCVASRFLGNIDFLFDLRTHPTFSYTFSFLGRTSFSTNRFTASIVGNVTQLPPTENAVVLGGPSPAPEPMSLTVV